MVEDAFYNRFFIIDVIVSDDDRTMQAVIKHPSIGVFRSISEVIQRKIDEEIPEPSFLADLSHHMNVFS